MKISTGALSVATLSLALLTPAFGQSNAAATPTDQPATAQQAQQMVPARATLSHALNAGDAQSGSQFRATLNDNVHLNGGAVLHRGDTLVGKVVTDDMNTPGKSRLALRITDAVLKNGQTIPVKATIVGLYPPGDFQSNGMIQPEQLPNDWNNSMVKVDQVGVVHDVDLHSDIASANSGVFVSAKNNVKIPGGSELALAIAPAQNTGSTNSGL